jgi:hypothetical protein
VVEAGAYSGRDIGVFFGNAAARNVNTAGMHFSLFEPMSVAFETLQRDFGGRPNVELHQSGLGDIDRYDVPLPRS